MQPAQPFGRDVTSHFWSWSQIQPTLLDDAVAIFYHSTLAQICPQRSGTFPAFTSLFKSRVHVERSSGGMGSTQSWCGNTPGRPCLGAVVEQSAAGMEGR